MGNLGMPTNLMTKGEEMEVANHQAEGEIGAIEHLPKIELALGKIVLDCENFLELRPGMELRFETPETFEGVLSLDGRPWAKVQVRRWDKELRLSVVEIYS